MKTLHLARLWMLLITHTGFVCGGDLQFVERHVGESVMFSCEPTNDRPLAVYLKRKWLKPSNVVFMLAGEKPSVLDNDNDKRISVIGDLARQLNVSISHLRTSDSDRYYCEFVFDSSVADEHIPGKNEFFLHVDEAAVPGSLEIRHVEVCSGGSAVLPCLPPHGERSLMEGVTLKRWRGRTPVQVLYHSKHHHHSPSSEFPSERLELSTASGPEGMAYNITLLQLRPEDSAFYSCLLLVPDRPDSSSSLGRRVFYVSVQGGHCGCTSYATLLYAMTSAVAVLLLFLIALLVICRRKAHDRVKPQPHAPIYEEMVGVQPPGHKKRHLHLEETDTSVYNNSLTKSRLENPYESNHGALLNAAGDHEK